MRAGLLLLIKPPLYEHLNPIIFRHFLFFFKEFYLILH